jgi:hypothetical protein
MLIEQGKQGGTKRFAHAIMVFPELRAAYLALEWGSVAIARCCRDEKCAEGKQLPASPPFPFSPVHGSWLDESA